MILFILLGMGDEIIIKFQYLFTIINYALFFIFKWEFIFTIGISSMQYKII